MDVTSIPSNPTSAPFVFSNDNDNHRGHGNGHDGSWYREAERVKDVLTSQNLAQALAQAAANTASAVQAAGISKDVAVLSRDVVISEGRIQVQIGTVTKDVAVLSKDVALTEARLQLQMSQLAAQQAQCCCDLKELVREQNGLTRELIQGNKILELEAIIAAGGGATATARVR